MFFALASLFSESFSWSGARVVGGIILLFGSISVVGFLSSSIGGILQIVVGLILLIGYPLTMTNMSNSTIVIMELIFGLPVFLSGVLHIVSFRLERLHRKEERCL